MPTTRFKNYAIGLAVAVIGLVIWFVGGNGKHRPPQPHEESHSDAAESAKQRHAFMPPQPKTKGWEGDPDPQTSDKKPGLDFTGLRGVLAGKWEKKNQNYHRLQFTEKSIESNHGYSTHVGKHEAKGDLLHVTDRAGAVNVYGLEFVSEGEIALRPEKVKNGTDFNDLAGRWRRTSLPPGGDPASPGTGPVADAKRQVKRIEQKEAKLESLLATAQADRDDLVAKLRAVGVKTSADLKGNVRGQRLAENVAKIATEIDGLERQLAVMDSELLKAKSIVRRMEREEAGLSDDEMRRLAGQLKDVQERTDGVASTPTTPLDVEAAVEKALQATPAAQSPKKSK